MSQPLSCPSCSHIFAWGADDDSAIVDAQGERWRSCRENAHWKLTFHMQANHPEAAMLCPRRGEGGPFSDHGSDYWHESDGVQACSYCGSIHPDAFFAAIEAGHQLGPTDKSYKVYVDLSNPAAGKPSIRSSANFNPGDGWIEVTEARIAEWKAQGVLFVSEPRLGSYVQIGKEGPIAHAKFYFQHLSEEQRRRFVDLLNAKAMNIGYPGHFYRLPFFIQRQSKEVETA